MSKVLEENELEQILINILNDGATGSSGDFTAWVKLYQKLFQNQEIQIETSIIQKILDSLRIKEIASQGKFDPKEFTISQKELAKLKNFSKDSFSVLGKGEFSPIQYARSRQEYFLNMNKATEDEITDISIATIEAVENSVKYGDGMLVTFEQEVDSTRIYKIAIINNIKEFDLSDEIERGKYSSNITLMRGVMIMEKLFDKLDLQIKNELNQVHLYAEKKLS